MTFKEKLVIAVDFGTTYSGVAYVFPSQKNAEPVAVLDWPGSRGESAPKTPTLIAYNENELKTFNWGSAVDKRKDKIVGVKLLLDPNQEWPECFSTGTSTGTIIRDGSELPKPPAEIAKDYLKALHDHALKDIAKRVTSQYLEMCEREYVFSVPAVWSDAAKDATLKAAEAAGMKPITLIKEPEAAALYTFRNLGFSIKSDDAFVVCDAGGGTVDLVSYEVESLHPTTRIKELVPGNGAMIGSLALNHRFSTAVENLVGPKQWKDLKNSKAFAQALKQFDREIKKEFGVDDGEEEEEFYVTFPMADLDNDPFHELESNTWRMVKRDLENIFNPVMLSILKLIEGQVNSAIKKRGGKDLTAILLVGGFGSSRYLKAHVEKAYPDIQVLQPQDAWAAIVKGAALSKIPLQVTVASSCATRHYGTRAAKFYNAFIDAGQHSWYCDREGVLKVERMSWFISIGDDLHRNRQIRLPFYRTWNRIPRRGTIISERLDECEDEVAPMYPSKAINLRKTCEVAFDCSSVPRSQYHLQKGVDGKQYWKLEFDMVLTLKSAMMVFSIEVNRETMALVDLKPTPNVSPCYLSF